MSARMLKDIRRAYKGKQIGTVYVAKAAGFAFLRVVKAACPIDSNVALVTAQSCRTLCVGYVSHSLNFEFVGTG